MRGRTPSVRRQSAAKSGHSPESPPSATCCLPRTSPHQSLGATTANPQTGWTTKLSQNPSALSFPIAWVITPKLGRDATALPHTNCCLGMAVFVTRPSSDSPHTLPRAFYSGHSPPQRHTRFNEMNRCLMTKPDCRSANSGRRCGSCVSVDLRLRVHVTRTCYRPTRSGVSRLPADHTFSANCQWQSHRISPYESRSSGYRS